MARLPSLNEVHAALMLDTESGVLRWRRDIYTVAGRATCFKAGQQAGGTTPVVKVAGKYHAALTVAWMLAYGVEPKGAVVPLDGDLQNLRPSNLLDCGTLHASPDAPRLSLEDSLTAQEARQLFSYDHVTGILRWQSDRRTSRGYFTAHAGDAVGGIDKKGYLVVRFQPPRSPVSLFYFVHRLAWLVVTGAWPAAEVDHVNGDKADNRWHNLRHADDELNSQNRRKANRNNSAGLLGVTYDPRTGKYASRIGHRRALHSLGSFDTPEAAHEAYVQAKRRLHAGGTL